MTGVIDITQADVEAKRWAIHAHHHVVPIGDLRDHDLSPDCHCGPREEEQASGVFVYVHHAYDQRENDE